MPVIKNPLGRKGITLDVPPESLPADVADVSLNLRPSIEGKLAGCPVLLPAITAVTGPFVGSAPYDLGAWIPAGSTQLFVGVISKDAGDNDNVTILKLFAPLQTDEITSGTINTIYNDEFKATLTVYNETFIVNTGSDVPAFITASAPAGTNLLPIPNWFGDNIFAGRLVPWKNRLVALNLYDDQGTTDTSDDTFEPVTISISSNATLPGVLDSVQWQISSINDADDNFLTQTSGAIIDAVPLRDSLMVYKRDAIFRVTETNDPTFPFRYEVFNTDDGALSSECVVVFDNAFHFIVGTHGIYVTDGASSYQNISQGQIENAFYSDIQSGDEDRTFAFHYGEEKELWVCYSSISNNGLGCDSAFVFNYTLQAWYKRTLPNVTKIIEVDLEGSNRVFAVSPEVSGTILELRRDTFEPDGFMTWTDRDFGDNSLSKRLNNIYIKSDEEFMISVQATGLLNQTTTPVLETFDPSISYQHNLRRIGRYFTTRIEMINALSPGITSIDPELLPSSRR